MPKIRPANFCWIPALLVLAIPACSKKVVLPTVENQRPIVEFSRAPSRSGDLYSYAYELHWRGYDPDGDVSEFLYAIDPPAPTSAQPEPDSAWVHTTANGGTFRFTATSPLPIVPGTNPLSTDYHVFILKAVDNRSLVSAPAVVAFNAATVAPTVRILSPTPSTRFKQYLTPSVLITWDGSDLDGIASKKPVSYRVKLLTASTAITPALLTQYPDTAIRYYQPRNWATWDSLPGTATQYQLSTLAPEQDYAFCVIAYDEAGAYTPYTSGDVNVLNFRALYANAGGPLLTIYNEFFTYTYSQGVYLPNDRNYDINLEVPGGVPLEFHWSAEALTGTYVRSFRWVVDPEDLQNSVPRTNELTDIQHWSQPGFYVNSTVLSPFNAAGDHRLYIEVEDGNGLKSLGVVHFQVVVAVFDRPLGIVDDTRLLLDRRQAGSATCIDRPLGRFPTAAELDTFLYARGGVPIRCYPAGSVSRPGLFRGYDYDTLNTRTGKSNPTPSLALLARYRRLIWLGEPGSADHSNPGSDLVDGSTALRYINALGHLNVLTAYVRQGGEVWFAGGGTMSAAISSYNVTSNDRPSRTYSAAAGELRPGRFVYDMAHWRSEFIPVSGLFQIRTAFGRLASNPGSYSMLPATMLTKSLAAGDTLPPWRTSNGDFYVSAFTLEAMTKPNPILEDQDPSSFGVDLQSVMDTLYSVTGGTLPANSTIMTVYHGAENSRIIVTGFDLWSFQRVQLRQLVDAVLQGIWGLTRRPEPARVAPARVSAWSPSRAHTGTN